MAITFSRAWRVGDVAVRFVFFACAMLAATSGKSIAESPISPAIVGGDEVPALEWSADHRWMVAIQYAPYDELICGGTLIAPTWVLTAAHCLDGLTPDEINVLVDSPSLSSAQAIPVQRVIVHESYTAAPSNDIALLQLSSAAPAEIVPVQLATTSDDADHAAPGTLARILGWGLTDVRWGIPGLSGVSDTLLRLGMRTTSTQSCQLAYGPVPSIASAITDDMICSVSAQAASGGCFGDDGGPLAVQVGDHWIQVGIVVGAFNCEQSVFPLISTRVSQYRDWIAQQMAMQIVQVTAADSHSCALADTGEVFCWGTNTVGQLGDGTPIDRLVATRVVGIEDAVQISAFYYSSCALRRNGHIVCWGDDVYGQLGDGTQGRGNIRDVPVSVVGVQDATQVAAGGLTTCALRSGGRVACWGYNGSGTVGDGTNEERLAPTWVINLRRATQISAGSGFNCALRDSGRVSCWGFNLYGQLGLGNTTRSLSPVFVAFLRNAVQVAAGYNHTCALRSNVRVACWGYNAVGQLGDGTTTDRLTPVTVSHLSDATQVAAGGDFTCAVRASGRVACWGSNNNGQLGDGTTTDRSRPTTVRDILDATQVALGLAHACALRADGRRVSCWGRNQEGQLGDGTRTDSLRPVDVVFPAVH